MHGVEPLWDLGRGLRSTFGLGQSRTGGDSRLYPSASIEVVPDEVWVDGISIILSDSDLGMD